LLFTFEVFTVSEQTFTISTDLDALSQFPVSQCIHFNRFFRFWVSLYTFQVSIVSQHTFRISIHSHCTFIVSGFAMHSLLKFPISLRILFSKFVHILSFAMHFSSFYNFRVYFHNFPFHSTFTFIVFIDYKFHWALSEFLQFYNTLSQFPQICNALLQFPCSFAVHLLKEFLYILSFIVHFPSF